MDQFSYTGFELVDLLRTIFLATALILLARDAEFKLMLYTAVEIQRSKAENQVLQFVAYWKRIQRHVKSTLVFDSKFTKYEHLSELNDQDIKYITLRRRGKKLIDQVDSLSPWRRIHIPHAKRKYLNPYVYESTISLRHYQAVVRQLVVRGNGHEQPAFKSLKLRLRFL
ncbi:MAG: hypothetical protein JXR73_00965 [Candidatus Omnitrophica bacterium]|nr:hypothetical protein [Candidatus Omnitrophota bacterium]